MPKSDPALHQKLKAALEERRRKLNTLSPHVDRAFRSSFTKTKPH